MLPEINNSNEQVHAILEVIAFAQKVIPYISKRRGEVNIGLRLYLSIISVCKQQRLSED